MVCLTVLFKRKCLFDTNDRALSLVCFCVAFPELEKALGLKLQDTLNVENESSKRKVSVI